MSRIVVPRMVKIRETLVLNLYCVVFTCLGGFALTNRRGAFQISRAERLYPIIILDMNIRNTNLRKHSGFLRPCRFTSRDRTHPLVRTKRSSSVLTAHSVSRWHVRIFRGTPATDSSASRYD